MEYTNVNGYLVPNLVFAESETPSFGKYGRLRLKYLREHEPITHDIMLVEGKLTAHLNEIDRTATEQVERLICRMAKQQGVNEELKRRNQLEWVGAMNNIKSSAEEIVLHDFVFNLP